MPYPQPACNISSMTCEGLFRTSTDLSRQRFDFALKFNNSLLGILPSTLLLLVTPVRIFQLARQTRKALRTSSLLLKLVSYSFLAQESTT